MLTLPRIEINNPTFEGEVQTATLQSLLKYNLKEMKKGVSTRPAHRLYYVNANEAITYNSRIIVYNGPVVKAQIKNSIANSY